MKKYLVTLTDDERQQFQELTHVAAASKPIHARILLKADQAPGGPAWADDRIADALDVGISTIARVRQRFVEAGLDAALDRKKLARPNRPRKLDPVHGLRATVGLARGAGDGAAHCHGLRGGAGVAGGGGRRRGEGRAGAGQSGHAQAGVGVRGVRAGAGAADRGEGRVALHAQARVAAEHG